MFSSRFRFSFWRTGFSASSLLLILLSLGCSAAKSPGRAPWWQGGRSAPPRVLKFIRAFGSSGSEPGQFLNPQGISVDPEGNIYVADTGNHRVQKFDARGRFIEEIGGFGWGEAQFNHPIGLTAREGLNIYVVDSQNRRVQRFDRSLNYLSSVLSIPEEGQQLTLGFLWGIEVASTGELFVSDVENEQLLKLTSFGEVDRSFGGFESGPERLRAPAGLTVTPWNAICVADVANDRIASYDSFGGFLGTLGEGVLKEPRGLEVDNEGFLFVVDTGHDRICVFSPQGELLFSLGGTGGGFGSFQLPSDLAVFGTDWVCVLDSGNNRVQIFEIVR
jgi:DNA-binding beta-propeller fold protein YncE